MENAERVGDYDKVCNNSAISFEKVELLQDCRCWLFLRIFFKSSLNEFFKTSFSDF
jgi:hypothetical protein